MGFSADKGQLGYAVFIDGSEGVVKEDVAQQQTQQEYLTVIAGVLLNRTETFGVEDPYHCSFFEDGLAPYIDALCAGLSGPTGLKTLVVEKQGVEEKRFAAAIVSADADKAKGTLEAAHVLDGLRVDLKS
jgi:hypothetical protein